jgi:hypothetical protein
LFVVFCLFVCLCTSFVSFFKNFIFFGLHSCVWFFIFCLFVC